MIYKEAIKRYTQIDNNIIKTIIDNNINKQKNIFND